MRKRNRAFTMIEILVVIAVLAILMTLLYAGMKYIQNNAKKNSTRVTLQNLSSMKAELDRVGAKLIWPGTNAAEAIGDSVDATKVDYSRDPATAQMTVQTIVPPIMAQLLNVPENKASFGKLPSNQLAPNNVVLDSWGNPVIYVPPGGLANVGLGLKSDGSQIAGIPANTLPIQSPDKKGFWASAGPDGDFSKGDDNLYSFE
ncbi:MAG TPA: prepilin-type N-terminal cleavage/methylation domain-containing protein [Tepidisphaeraceae bacterium]